MLQQKSSSTGHQVTSCQWPLLTYISASSLWSLRHLITSFTTADPGLHVQKMARVTAPSVLLLLLAAALMMSYASRCSATVYTVGDSAGWATGVDYATWLTGKSFVVGDSLVFNYGSGMHNVAEVTESDYSSCTAINAVAADGSGATTFELKTAGTHYYICAAPGHCSSGGMKLAVPVLASATGAAAPAASAAPGSINAPPVVEAPTSTPAAATPIPRASTPSATTASSATTADPNIVPTKTTTTAASTDTLPSSSSAAPSPLVAVGVAAGVAVLKHWALI